MFIVHNECYEYYDMEKESRKCFDPDSDPDGQVGSLQKQSLSLEFEKCYHMKEEWSKSIKKSLRYEGFSEKLWTDLDHGFSLSPSTRFLSYNCCNPS